MYVYKSVSHKINLLYFMLLTCSALRPVNIIKLSAELSVYTPNARYELPWVGTYRRDFVVNQSLVVVTCHTE